MPNINPKVAGDNFYPVFNAVWPRKVGAITITKGRLYTCDNNGYLIAPTVAGFIRGIYQASRSILLAGTAGQHSVDCFAHRSRVGLDAKTIDLHPGDIVQYDIVNNNVEKWTVAGNVSANDINKVVGRIYEIYSKTDLQSKKDVTAIGDVVVVDLGGAI